MDLGDVEVILARAESLLEAENLKELEPLLDRAEASTKARVADILKERYPRLFLETSSAGLQANRWNQFELRITNKGNWPAKAVTPTVLGPADVQGLRALDTIEPNEEASLEFGIRPHDAGTMDLDFEVHYSRPLDDGKYQVTDASPIRVELEESYVVDDAILVHEDGDLICHESRAYTLPEERSVAGALESEAKTLAREAFGQREAAGIQRTQSDDRTLVALRGPHACIILGLRGEEPAILPLYIMQSLQEIEEAFGPQLEKWAGDSEALEGIRSIVRKLLFVTDVPGVSLGPLEDSPVSRVPALIEKGLLAGEGDQDFLAWAREAIGASGYEEGTKVLERVAGIAAGPTEEISAQIHQAVLASRESGGLDLSDEQIASYVGILQRALEAVIQAKQRMGLQRYWPVARVALKASDQFGYDAVSAFRKIIVAQSGAKELDIVAPNETWRGMKIQVDVNMDSVSAAYRLWARKIEILLRSQDAWKIKAGLARGEYSVGIEGQKVRIDPSMVSFLESLPEHVIEEQFDGGTVYIDTRMTKDLLSEGYAQEIASIIGEARRELGLPEDRVVEVDVVCGKSLESMLKPWIDLIMREANALDVRFASEAPSNAYVVEAELGEQSFLVAVRAAEM